MNYNILEKQINVVHIDIKLGIWCDLKFNVAHISGVHYTKHVWVYVSAQKRYWFELCCIMYTYSSQNYKL